MQTEMINVAETQMPVAVPCDAEPMKSKLEVFYDQRLKDSTVVTMESIKEALLKEEHFDWEEFNKPLNEVNMMKVVQSLRDLSIAGKWKQKVSKNAKSQKAAIQSFNLEKSYSFNIGQGKHGGLLHLKDLKSRFASHSYAFGDDSQKNMMTEPISVLEEARRSVKFEAVADNQKDKPQEPHLSKKATKATIEFLLYTEDQKFQNDESLEQIKYMMLVHYAIAQQVVNEMLGSPSGKDKIVVKVQGAFGTAYDESKEADVTKMKLNFDCLPLYADSDKVAVVSIKDAQQLVSSDEFVKCDDIFDKVRTIQDLLTALRFKNLDLFVAIDSCSVKKMGREVIVMPQFKIIQSVLRDQQQQQKRHVGLKLFR